MSSDPSNAPYRVVARRFRPKSFDEVVGQAAVLTQLRSALKAGKVPHALLFSGSRGVGKTTMARIVARALNCEVGVGPAPCGECQMCTSILAGNNPDVVEIDAASHNLVDDIRELRDRVGFASMGARYKVYILDEVHMLTRNAFNAFLKTLEEPPPNVVFILATTESHKVPETIRSRCQSHLFRRIDDSDIVARLRTICEHEQAQIDDAVLEEIASSVRGGMRDAETALERVLPIAVASSDGFGVDEYRQLVQRVGIDRVTDVVTSLGEGDGAAGLHFAASVAESGVDEREALGEVVDLLRAILLLSVDGKDSGLVPHSGTVRERLVALAERHPVERIDAMIQAGLLGRDRIRRLDDRRLVLELALVRMAEAGCVPGLAELAAAVQGGAAASSPRAAASAIRSSSPSHPGSSKPASRPGASSPADSAEPAAARRRASSARGAATLAGRLASLIEQRKPMLGTTLAACDVEGPDDAGVVTLTLRSQRKMHVGRLGSPEVRALLQELIDEAAGSTTKLVIRPGAGTSPAVSKAAPKAGASKTASPAADSKSVGESPPVADRAKEPPAPDGSGSPGRLAERIKDKFDGQILDPE